MEQTSRDCCCRVRWVGGALAVLCSEEIWPQNVFSYWHYKTLDMCFIGPLFEESSTLGTTDLRHSNIRHWTIRTRKSQLIKVHIVWKMTSSPLQPLYLKCSAVANTFIKFGLHRQSLSKYINSENCGNGMRVGGWTCNDIAKRSACVILQAVRLWCALHGAGMT